MADLREHELHRKYDLCCLSCCEVEVEDVKANPQAGIPAGKKRKCADSEDNCKDLQKKTTKDAFDYKPCSCVLFRLKKEDPKPPAAKHKWEPVTDPNIDLKNDPTPKADEDKEYYYACFCVAER